MENNFSGLLPIFLCFRAALKLKTCISIEFVLILTLNYGFWRIDSLMMRTSRCLKRLSCELGLFIKYIMTVEKDGCEAGAVICNN